MSRAHGTLPLTVGLAGIVVGALLGYWGGTMMLRVDAVAAGGDRPSYPILVVVIGAIIGIATPLAAIGWYLRRTVDVRGQRHRTQALWIGLVWGTAVMLLAGPVNALVAALPGGAVYPGFVEELLKLLLPVILLLCSRTYRAPALGAWLVFVVSAWLGVLEGISYIVTATDPILDGAAAPSDAPFIMMMDVIVRVLAEVTHPLITVGAAIIIWIAARTSRAGRAVIVGFLAYLGAAVIHGLNDAVLDGPVRDFSVPLSIALTAVYVILITVFWFRPQVHRLHRDTVAEHSSATRIPS